MKKRPLIDVMKGRKRKPLGAICALFPELLADSLRVESALHISLSFALPLAKYCFGLERHFFRVRGAHPRVRPPVYVPTFHLHAVYLGKLRKECLPLSLFVSRADGEI